MHIICIVILIICITEINRNCFQRIALFGFIDKYKFKGIIIKKYVKKITVSDLFIWFN